MRLGKLRSMSRLGLSLVFALAFLISPLSARAEFGYETIPTPHMIVMDGTDGTVFFERAADERAYPASTTKIMTCILALESGNLDDAITVGDEVLGTTIKFTKYSSLMGLVSGETVTLRDLVYGLMLVSGNDAAEAIAVHMGGSVDGFVKMMNDKAAALGMTNTHYANPHGVQNENHYTTARDMAKLTMYALNNSDFVDIAKTVSYTVPASNLRAQPMVLDNANRLIKKPDTDTVSCVYENAIGVKTGDTNAAGKCLVAAAEKNGARIIAVLYGDTAEMYGDDTVKANLARFQNAAGIFEDLFNNTYQTMDGSQLNLQTAFDLPVSDANEEDLVDGTLKVNVDVSGLTVYGTEAQLAKYQAGAGNIQTDVQLAGGELRAPIASGTFLGTVNYVLDGVVLHSASLIAPSEVRAVAVIKTGGEDIQQTPATEPGSTPLIQRPGIQIGVFGWLMILLMLLLIALIVVFIISEKKRRQERARKRRAHYGAKKRR